MSVPPRIHLILPAYNEGGNLLPLFNGFRALPDLKRYRFYLVNDGSTDNTLEEVSKIDKAIDLNLINNPKNLGLSKTLLTGLNAALSEATSKDYIVFMDGDNTHLPSQVPELISKLESGADIAIASRYRDGSTIDGLSNFRKSFSILASVLFRFFLPVNGVKDFSCGFRAMKASLLSSLTNEDLSRIFSTRGFACTTGLLLALTRDPLVKVEEIPMQLKYNQKRGVSKMNLKQTSVESLKLIFKEWQIRNRAQ